jgi:hypothetical protein
LSFYEGVRVGVLKIEESESGSGVLKIKESELLCTDSTARVQTLHLHLHIGAVRRAHLTFIFKFPTGPHKLGIKPKLSGGTIYIARIPAHKINKLQECKQPPKAGTLK